MFPVCPGRDKGARLFVVMSGPLCEESVSRSCPTVNERVASTQDESHTMRPPSWL
jgi:hypothetical protein